jgi:hypothetical protein
MAAHSQGGQLSAKCTHLLAGSWGAHVGAVSTDTGFTGPPGLLLSATLNGHSQAACGILVAVVTSIKHRLQTTTA